MSTIKELYRRNRIVSVCLILMMVFALAQLYAGEEYGSNTKSPTGSMESRNMYFPGTEELDLDKIRMTLNRLVQAIENTPEKRWEFKTVKVTEAADKKAIKDAIKAGKDVPGCSIIENLNLKIN